MNPYSFQTKAATAIVTILETEDSVLLQSATGSGKTFISALTLLQLLAQQRKHSLFVVNRTTLISQVYETLKAVGLKPAVLHNECKADMYGVRFSTDVNKCNVVITMPETFANMLDEVDGWTPSYIVFDEAHKATSAGFQFIKNYYADAKVIGLTATPYRDRSEEGESLKEWYSDRLVTTVSVKELIELGVLVQPIYRKYNIDTDHVVRTWHSLVEGSDNKRTIIFTQDTKHSLKIEQAFAQTGVNVAVITTSDEDGATPQTINQRNQIYKKFREGLIDVLVSVNALCEGFDERQARVCMLLRNVGNIALYHQMVGRVLRSYPEKDDCIIADFCNNVQKYGPIEDWEWEMGDGKHHTVGNGESMSYKLYGRYERLFTVCTCNNVFDIKKFDVCPQCNEPHSVQVYETFENIRNKMFSMVINRNQKSQKYYVDLMASKNVGSRGKKLKVSKDPNYYDRQAYAILLQKIKLARDKNMGRAFNKMIGVKIFTSDDTLHHRLRDLDALLNVKFDKMIGDDKVRVI